MFLIYLHIPFCLRKCPYCDFYTLPYTPQAEEDYLAFVSSQICDYLRRFPDLDGRRVDTLYIGGGSPSCVSPSLLRRLLGLLKVRFDLSCLKEFSVEANPGDVDADLLRRWRDLGVDRVSLGVQTFDERHLSTLGRTHRVRQAREAIEMAGDIFPRISVDLMFGIPGQTLADWERDLKTALSFGLRHISLYDLTIEPGTRFYERYRNWDKADLSARMYELADEVLRESGLVWYEISNFAVEGQESRHNLGYWLGAEFLGIGPSAWSFVKGVRFVRWWDGRQDEDKLSPEGRMREDVLLRLRTRWGVEKGLLEDLVGKDWIKQTKAWWQEIDGRYVLTLKGRLFYDSVATGIVK